MKPGRRTLPAQDWALGRRRDPLRQKFVMDLHKRMLGGERFSWGSANLQAAGDVRRRYLAALKAADNHDIGPLLAFARS
jgi:hypothetical protein